MNGTTTNQKNEMVRGMIAEAMAWDFHLLSAIVALFDTVDDVNRRNAIAEWNAIPNTIRDGMALQDRSYRHRRCVNVGTSGLGTEARCVVDVNTYNTDEGADRVCETCGRGNGPVVHGPDGRRVLGAEYHAREAAEARRIAEVLARR